MQRLVSEIHLHRRGHVQFPAAREIFQQQERIHTALETGPVDEDSGYDQGNDHAPDNPPDAAFFLLFLHLLQRDRLRLRIRVNDADDGVGRALFILHGLAQRLHLAAAGLAKLMDQMNDEQHQQRRKSGQHDPHPPDGERGQHRKLYGLPGSLKGQIAADLGRLHLLPNAVFVFHIEIQLSALPIGRAEADRMRICAVIRQAKLPLLDDGTRHMRGGRMAVRNVFAIFPNCLRDAG